MQSYNRIPLEIDGRRYRLMPGAHPLLPVRFTLQEARALYLATRLYLRHADDRDPDAVSAVEKMAGSLPDAIARQMSATVGQVRRRPTTRARREVLCKLTEAWALSRTVAIRYRSATDQTLRRTDLAPYLLEPSANGAATYVIGFSHAHEAVRTFKTDRILRADLTQVTFEPPDTAQIVDQISRGWGVVFGDDKFDIVVDFSASVAARVRETTWHPSQKLAVLPDGGVRMELQLPSLLEFVPWVRSWGAEARVVAPRELRAEVAESLRAAVAYYGGDGTGPA